MVIGDINGLRQALLESEEYKALMGKTQVLYNPVDNIGLKESSEEVKEDPLYTSTRGTHTEEVAYIAKEIATKLKDLGVDVDPFLAQLGGLSHDVGHTPFGHDGEAVLDNLLAQKMEELSSEEKEQYFAKREALFGTEYEEEQAKNREQEREIENGKKARGEKYKDVSDFIYEHNEHSVEVLEVIAKREGIELPQELKNCILAHSTSRVKENPHALEAQIVRLADKIAYVNRDITDLMHNGIVKEEDIKNYFDKRLESLMENNPDRSPEELRAMVEKERVDFDEFLKLTPEERIEKAINETIQEYQTEKIVDGLKYHSVEGLTKTDQKRYKNGKIMEDVEERVSKYPAMGVAFFAKAIVDDKIYDKYLDKDGNNKLGNNRGETQEILTSLYDYYETNFEAIPEDFRKEWEGYTRPQIIAYFIASHSNSDIERLAAQILTPERAEPEIEAQKNELGKNLFTLDDCIKASEGVAPEKQNDAVKTIINEQEKDKSKQLGDSGYER